MNVAAAGTSAVITVTGMYVIYSPLCFLLESYYFVDL